MKIAVANKIKFAIILLMYIISCWQILWAANLSPLPVNQAFHLQVVNNNTDSLQASWQIASGYYIYKDRFKFTLIAPKEALLGKIILPAGIVKTDDILGRHEVYENQLQLSLPIANATKQATQLQIGYQGCSSSGFCYPPQLKLITVTESGAVQISDIRNNNTQININNNSAKQTDLQTTSILKNTNALLAILLFLGFGILLAFTPCVLPMIPILAGIILGQQQQGSKKAFLLSLTYVLSMAVTFAIAGMIVALLGDNVQAALQTPWVLISFSILFVILALSLFGIFELKLPNQFELWIAKLSQRQRAGTYFGVAVMGCLATLIVSPCVSAPLVGALAYIAQTGNAWFGAISLFALGLGMGLPLLFVGTALGKYLPKAGPWLEYIKIIFAILLLAVAVSLLSRIVSSNITLIMTGIIVIITACYLGLLTWPKQTALQKLNFAFSMVLLTVGGYWLCSGLAGNTEFFNQRLIQTNEQNNSKTANWHKVTNLAQLQAALSDAKQLQKPVIIDFYADWCVSCKEMAATTFQDQQVLAKFKNYYLITADVTNNDQDAKALANYYKVIAPPTIIFLSKDGKEIASKRIIGAVSSQDLLKQLM